MLSMFTLNASILVLGMNCLSCMPFIEGKMLLLFEAQSFYSFVYCNLGFLNK
jgi:hypothetical protein